MNFLKRGNDGIFAVHSVVKTVEKINKILITFRRLSFLFENCPAAATWFNASIPHVAKIAGNYDIKINKSERCRKIAPGTDLQTRR